jgi:hypothetical protein
VILVRIVFVSHDTTFRGMLAEAISRRLIQGRQDESWLRRLKDVASLSSLEKWGREYGPDRIQFQGGLKGGIPLVFETGAEVSLVWELDKEMRNKPPAEVASLARSVLGAPDTCKELLFLLLNQTGNSKDIPSETLVLPGDFRMVSGIIQTADEKVTMAQGDRRIEVEIDDIGWSHSSALVISGRPCEALCQVSKIQPLTLKCFAIWT